MLSEKLLSGPRRSFRLAIAMGLLSAGTGLATVPSAQAAPRGAYTTKGAYGFVSAPRLHPPKVRTDAPTSARKLAPGYFMVSNFKNLAMTEPLVGQGGPLILDSHLQPVWFNPISTSLFSLNLRAQTYLSKPALSWWQGVISPVGAVTSGEDIVVNDRYQTVAKLEGKDGWIISPHELLISGANAWVTAYKNVPMNLAPYGGSASGVLTDSAVQEYDLKNGKLLSTFDAFRHISLSQSQIHPSPMPGIPWDAYHVNSINLTGSGTFVTSMRNTWAAYKVKASTGTIEWTLGGKGSSFTFGRNSTFQWQHDVELHAGNEVSLFDDACCGVLGPGKFAPPSGPSRGLVLKLNTTTHTANLLAAYTAGHVGLETSTQGSAQLLRGGNVLVGWGGQPWFSEYSKSGKLLFDARFPDPDISYRAYLQQWVGTPFFPPSGAARKSKGKTTVYASWDGATQVASWRVLGGPNVKHLKSLATRRKNGFETVIGMKGSSGVYKVQALDVKGHLLRTSKAFSIPRPRAKTPPPGFY